MSSRHKGADIFSTYLETVSFIEMEKQAIENANIEYFFNHQYINRFQIAI